MTTPASPAGALRVLDTYCCQGGATRGYQLAGFHVTGVDIAPQPRYCGSEFYQDDAITFLRRHRAWIRATFTLVHASPPCQAHTLAQRIRGRDHPDLIAPTRDALEEIGLPYVIENVPGAPLRDPVLLCGAMPAMGLRTYRHRLFETGGGLTLAQPEHPEHVAPLAKMGRPARPHEFRHYVGNFSGVQDARADMGMPWVNRDGLREAIPPVYTLHIGRALLATLAAIDTGDRDRIAA
ncbi:DNA cytosine methyltransferase [Microbispora sp. NPDC049633]|uniref:DNA cytosine methyltransferase n=1 Tax=Microbispora sp. NPDC049633 TaxID=3154355 RepID=UPI003424B083